MLGIPKCLTNSLSKVCLSGMYFIYPSSIGVLVPLISNDFKPPLILSDKSNNPIPSLFALFSLKAE